MMTGRDWPTALRTGSSGNDTKHKTLRVVFNLYVFLNIDLFRFVFPPLSPQDVIYWLPASIFSSGDLQPHTRRTHGRRLQEMGRERVRGHMEERRVSRRLQELSQYWPLSQSPDLVPCFLLLLILFLNTTASLPRFFLDESSVCHKAGGSGWWPKWRRGRLHLHCGLNAEEQAAQEENGGGHGDYRLCHLWGKEAPLRCQWKWQ